jgi:formylglycine-generating enzyme required for sulfatase activity
MSEIPDDDQPAAIVDEFLRRLDAGENPEVEEYAARHPKVAAKLRTLIALSQGLRPPSPPPPADKPIKALRQPGEIRSDDRPALVAAGGLSAGVLPATRPVPPADPAAPARPRRWSRFEVGLLVAGAIVAMLAMRWSPPPGADEPPRPPPAPPVTTPPPSDPSPIAKPPDHVVLAGTSFVYVPKGQFEMGSTEDQLRHLLLDPNHERRLDKLRSEIPRRTVQITKPFYFGVYEVTVKEFGDFVMKTGYRTEFEQRGQGIGWVPKFPPREEGPQFSWKNPGWEQPDNHPVVNVTWNDAEAFCRWKTEVEKARYRLPTEAEWEYVCSAGGRPAAAAPGKPELAWANVADLTLKAKDRLAKVEDRLNDKHPFTAPVGSFPPNTLGVYDLTGNVLEWCSDWHSPNYEGAALFDPVGPPAGTERVARGGSWSHTYVDARQTSRMGAAPQSSGNYTTGFRLVREIPDP